MFGSEVALTTGHAGRVWPIREIALLLAASFTSATAHATTTEQRRGLMIAGQVMRNEGKLLRAREVFEACRGAPCDSADEECTQIRNYCGMEMNETQAEIPSVAIRVVDDRGQPIRANLWIDAAPVEPSPTAELDPGHHVVRASYAGSSGSAEVDLARRQRAVPVRITLDLRRTMATRPTPWPVYLFGALSGIASLTAIGFTIAAQKQSDDLAFCKPTCDPAREPLFGATTLTVDVSLIVAAASGLAALVTYLARPTRTHVVRAAEPFGR